MLKARLLPALIVSCLAGSNAPSHAMDRQASDRIAASPKGVLAVAAKPASDAVAAIPLQVAPKAPPLPASVIPVQLNRLPDGNVEFCAGPGHQ